MDQFQEFLVDNLGTSLLNLLAALLVLIVGYIVARLLAGLTRRILKRIDVDNRIATRMSEDFDLPHIDIENVAASIVFWIVLLLAIGGAVQRLNLVAITAAINPLVTEISTTYIPGIVAALLLALAAWVVAVVLRAIVTRLCKLAKLDERLSRYGALRDEEQVSITDTLGVLVFWLVILAVHSSHSRSPGHYRLSLLPLLRPRRPSLLTYLTSSPRQSYSSLAGC